MSEIIIDINDGNKAKKFENKSLFQIKAFENITKILDKHTYDENNSANIVNCRFHDTIFIDGDRGVGKTAFMLNIENYYNQKASKKYVFFNPVDPTLLEHTEKFLSVILAKIVEKVNCDIKNNAFSTDSLEIYYAKLEKLSESLSAIKTLPNDLGIEEIASNKSSLKLEQHAHEFFKEVSNLFKVDALVMLIDDIDMAFDKGFDVLEVVRKYLASPYLISIVAGDMNLYKEIIETQFMDKIKFGTDIDTLKNVNEIVHANTLKNERLESFQKIKDIYQEKKSLVDNLVEQYINKLFPNEYHIKLKDIFTIIKENEVNVKLFDEKEKKDITIPFTEIKDFEIRHINLGINQKKLTFKVFVNNTRKLIQYLTSKKDIYINFFRDIEYPKENKYQKYLPQNVINKYDDYIMKFISTPDYKESIEITCKIYEYSQDIKLSKYLNYDISSYINNIYNIHSVISNNGFEDLIIEKEKAKNEYVIQYKNISNVIKEKSNYNEIENYIIDLFIHNDYKTQHQTKNYIFAGKFVELIIFSLSIPEKVDIEINKIVNVIEEIKKVDFDYLLSDKNDGIYSTIFDLSSNGIHIDELKESSEFFNNLKIEKDYQELSIITNKVPFNSDRIDDEKSINKNYEDEVIVEYKTDQLSRLIILWKSVFYKMTKLNTLSLYRIIDKFYENINALKSQRFKNDTPLDMFKRIVLVFINSVAYFENTNLRTADSYICMNTNNFNLSNILTKTNSSTLNIKPLLNNENSLTKALFFHPVISHILFPDADSKLLKLIFTNQVLSVDFNAEEFLKQFYDYNLKAIQIIHKIYLLRQLLDKCTDEELKLIVAVDNFKNRFLTDHIRTATDEQLKLFNSLRKEIFNRTK